MNDEAIITKEIIENLLNNVTCEKKYQILELLFI